MSESFMEEVRKLGHIIRQDIGEEWQQLRHQWERVEAMMDTPASSSDPEPAPPSDGSDEDGDADGPEEDSKA